MPGVRENDMKMTKALAPLVILLGVAGFAVYWNFIRDSWVSPQVVRIATDDELTTLFPAYPMWFSKSEKGDPQALLLKDGDYVLGDNYFYRYAARDGAEVALTHEDGITRIGATVISLSPDKEDAAKWLAAATDAQLAELRTLYIREEPDAEVQAAIERLAAVNPNLDLAADEAEEELLPGLLSKFHPKAVLTGEHVPAAALADQPQLELLMMEADAPGALDVLPGLPGLRRLYLTLDTAEAGQLPQGLEGLRSLSIFTDDSDGAVDLETLPAGLEELSLTSGVADLGALARFHRLHTLVIFTAPGEDAGAAPPDLAFLASLKKLRWVGLPPWVTQDQLAEFVGSCPEVRVLQLADTEDDLDLAPLRELKKLEAITVGSGYRNLEALQDLKTLRYVAVSEKIWDESPELIASLRKSLPDAVIVRSGGLCLGSGWILVLVPVLAWAWRRRRLPSSVHAAA